MKLLLLVLTVILTPAQATKVMKCWGSLGICRTTCEEGEVFYILCNAEAQCCVNPKYVPDNTKSSNSAGSLGSPLQPDSS
ncbi:beta-defensin 121 [Eptesicus fuscus]|uniref:beta-defensin 121 n=1 Tax=Eptesicus fuscus TaxID=29078 RepID=UPI0024044184|nr:beta-defensin 121 [Eptesicus fuscus]